MSGKPREKGAGSGRKRPKLIVAENGHQLVLQLDQRITTIGRSHDNTVEIDDVSSSRLHCQIERKDGGYEIVDLKSRNGTVVNGVLVLRKELRPGDCIEIGKTQVFFEHISQEYADETIDLTTDYFLEPLEGLEEEDQLSVLKNEREIFLKLMEINRNLNSKVVLDDLLGLIVDTVVEVTSAERGFFLLAGEKELEVRAARNMDGETVKDPQLKFCRGIAEDVIDSRKPLCSDNAMNDRRFRDLETVKELNLKSVLCVPLANDDAVLGAIYVDNRFDENAFTSNHLRWLEMVAHQAAVAIRNAQLFDENISRSEVLEQTQRSLERANAQLEENVMKKTLQLEEAIKLIPEDQPAGFKYDYSKIITRSPKMFEIFRILDKVSESAVPVLILGESGTGKELIAGAIHKNGQRSEKEFISENCAAIPMNLMESEFFGHVKGAFTGATSEKKGLFEVADKGTLFLDEIADMPADMQTKLLRVLQEGEIRRVGGKEVINVDVRVVSATNKNIFDMVRKQEFREDLLYRINVITITLPPLRDRREDIPLLIDFFLDRIAERSSEKKKSLDRETFQAMYQHDWPGNVRELENEIERFAALGGDVIEPQLLSPSIQANGSKPGLSVDGKPLKDIVSRTVEDVERRVICSALVDTNWKKSKTAEMLGISRPTLDAKILKYALKREPGAEPGLNSRN